MRSGSTPATAHVTQPRERPQAQLARPVRVGDDAYGGAVVLAAGVACGDRRIGIRARHDRPQARQALQGGVRAAGARRCRSSARRRGRAPSPGRSPAAKVPSCWAATASVWERSANSSCSSRGIAYSRRRFSAVSIIPPGTGWLDAPRGHPRAGEAIVQGDARRPGAPAHPGGVELGLAHALRAAREHEVADPGLDLHACRARSPAARTRSACPPAAPEPPPAGPLPARRRVRSQAPRRSGSPGRGSRRRRRPPAGRCAAAAL